MNEIYINNRDFNKANNSQEEIEINILQIESNITNLKNEKPPKDELQLLIDKRNSLNLKNEKIKIIKKENPKRTNPKKICFYKRRIKFPTDLESFAGFFLTSFYLTFFSIMITICLHQTKKAYFISDNLKKTYDILIVIIWNSFSITMVLLFDVFSSDPGCQRGYPIPKEKYITSKIKKVVGGKKYCLKYCDTCHLIRDVRTFHCKICGICVEKHDHHCFRVSNCIGVYNYKKFYTFLNSSLVYLLIIFGICLHYLNYYNGKKTTKSWIFLLMVFITIFDLIFLLIVFSIDMQHIDVITSNTTIRESIKKKRYKVYDRGVKDNCDEALCRDYIKEM